MPSKTGFAYIFIVVERLLRVRPALVHLIWAEERDALDDHDSPKARTFRRNVMNESWWIEIEALVKTLNPVYTILRITDMEGSTLGLLYEYMDKIGESLNRNAYLTRDK